MKTIAISFAMIASLVALGREASAGLDVWKSAASGCVVRPADASKLDMDPVTGQITFAAGQSGTVKLTCPVSATLGDETYSNTFWVTLADGDGLGTTCNLWTNPPTGLDGNSTAIASLSGVRAQPTSSVTLNAVAPDRPGEHRVLPSSADAAGRQSNACCPAVK